MNCMKNESDEILDISKNFLLLWLVSDQIIINAHTEHIMIITNSTLMILRKIKFDEEITTNCN